MRRAQTYRARAFVKGFFSPSKESRRASNCIAFCIHPLAFAPPARNERPYFSGIREKALFGLVQVSPCCVGAGFGSVRPAQGLPGGPSRLKRPPAGPASEFVGRFFKRRQPRSSSPASCARDANGSTRRPCFCLSSFDSRRRFFFGSP